MYLNCPFLPGKIQGYESRSHSFDSNLNVFGPKLQPNCCFWVAVPYCFCIWAWKSYGFYFSSVLLLLITLVTKIPFRLNLHYLYASMPFSFHRNKCRFTQKWALHCRRKKKNIFGVPLASLTLQDFYTRVTLLLAISPLSDNLNDKFYCRFYGLLICGYKFYYILPNCM